MIKKGSLCSINGYKYEISIYKILKNCEINNKRFNTQEIKDLGKSSNNNDIICNFITIKDIPIEIKKYNTPDWMQLTLVYDKNNNKWIGNPNCKIPENSKKIFEAYINNICLFNNKIPPFINNHITYDEWKNIKKTTNDFNDMYILCKNDTIKSLYSEKNCKYIQISNKGLYHLGNDICNFNVPEFICEQILRIRIKVHNTNIKGYCKLSVTISCKPLNINNVEKSNYSLDDINKLPINLKFIEK